jgi:hypothetical protein
LKETHRGLFQDKAQSELQGLVVDGHSLLYFLMEHFVSYKRLQERTRQFVQWIQVPTVFVFDGHVPEYKRNVRVRRMLNKRKRQKELMATLDWNESFGSPMALPCIIQTLLEQEQIVYVAHEEADVVVARIAKEKGYHVLSNDSDYYFFDIEGYIPLSMVEWRESPRFWVARRVDLARRLRVPESLLSVFATLCGGDRFDLLGPKAVALRFQNPKLQHKGKPHKRFTNIIRWIQNAKTRDVGTFVEQFGEGLVGEEKYEWIEAMLEDAKAYAVVLEGEIPCFQIQPPKNPIVYPQPCTAHVQEYIQQGRALGILREMITNQEFWRRPFLEDPHLDSYQISYNIRCVLYQMLDLPVRECIVHPSHVSWKSFSREGIDLFPMTREWDVISFTIRHLLQYSSYSKQVIEKAFHGLLVSLYTCHQPWVHHGKVSVESIRITSEIETILFSLAMLSPMLISLPLVSFWKVFEPTLIHIALNQGLDPEQVHAASMQITGQDCGSLWSDLV